jgi:hypothetical protein
METVEEQYPECEKLAQVAVKHGAIYEFIKWLNEIKKIHLCKYGERDLLWPITTSTEKLLAEYFELDLNKIEQERKQILENMRKPK